jgi:hypothetical protein
MQAFIAGVVSEVLLLLLLGLDGVVVLGGGVVVGVFVGVFGCAQVSWSLPQCAHQSVVRIDATKLGFSVASHFGWGACLLEHQVR